MKLSILVFLITFSIFFTTGFRNNTKHHFFVPLAQGFLDGKLYVNKMEPELHEMIPEKEVLTGQYEELVDGEIGKYFVIFPPLPAVLLMPPVAIWGLETNQSYFSILLASISVAISYLIFKHLTSSNYKSFALSMLYAYGSMLWYHAIIGSAWYFAQVCGQLFIFLAILATLKKQNMFLIGFLIGCAYLSRYSLILSFPFFLYFTFDRWFIDKQLRLRPLFYLCISLSVLVEISLLYNWARYGELSHYGYTLLEKRPYNITNEYTEGSYSFAYAERTLKAMFWSFPIKSEYFPYFIPNSWAMAIWIVFPAIMISFFASLKEKIVRASWVAIIFILPASLFHGGIGASQFGFRYALDFMPFLLVLIALAIRKKFNWWQQVLFILSILVNIWGIWATF